MTPGICTACGSSIERRPGTRGPLPRRCDDCRNTLERRTRLASRIRECIVLAAGVGESKVERQLRNIDAMLAGVGGESRAWTRLGE